MTVIAFKHGLMSCDTLATYHGIKEYSGVKIFQYKPEDGAIVTYGFAGSVSLKHYVWESIHTEDTHFPEIPQGIEGDVLKAVYNVYDDTSELWHMMYGKECSKPHISRIREPFYAIGCGRALAIGAMAAGATAEEAVKIACNYDIECREPVIVVNTHEYCS
jgi:hypothetical protein